MHNNKMHTSYLSIVIFILFLLMSFISYQRIQQNEKETKINRIDELNQQQQQQQQQLVQQNMILEECTQSITDYDFPILHSTIFPYYQDHSSKNSINKITYWNRGSLFHSCQHDDDDDDESSICGVLLAHITESVFSFEPIGMVKVEKSHWRDWTSSLTTSTTSTTTTTTVPTQQPNSNSKNNNNNNAIQQRNIYKSLQHTCTWCPIITTSSGQSNKEHCINGTSLFATDIFNNQEIYVHDSSTQFTELRTYRSDENNPKNVKYEYVYKPVWIRCNFNQKITTSNTIGILTITFFPPRNSAGSGLTPDEILFNKPPSPLIATVNSSPSLLLQQRQKNQQQPSATTTTNNNNIVCITLPSVNDIIPSKLIYFIEHYIKLGFSRVLFYDVGLSSTTPSFLIQYNVRLQQLITENKLVWVELRDELQNLYGALASDVVSFGYLSGMIRSDCLNRVSQNIDQQQEGWVLFVRDLDDYLQFSSTFYQENIIPKNSWNQFIQRIHQEEHSLTVRRRGGGGGGRDNLKWIHFGSRQVHHPQLCACDAFSQSTHPLSLTSGFITTKNEIQHKYVRDHVAFYINKKNPTTVTIEDWLRFDIFNPMEPIYPFGKRISSNIALITRFLCESFFDQDSDDRLSCSGMNIDLVR
jgi:hypothetical protein